MKILKLNHKEAQQILQGKRTTWRLFDDKDLSVNDSVQLIDKVLPQDQTSWKRIGIARITKIVQKQLGQSTPHEYTQEGYKSEKEMLATHSEFYDTEVSGEVPVKVIYFEFSPEIMDDVEKSTHKLVEAKIFADGGSRGNPGPSASGFVILDMNDQVVVKKGSYLGVTTNNQAEYQAVKLALEEAQRLGLRIVHVHLDSLLVVNQMSGIYKVRNRDLWPIHAAIKEAIKQFKKVSFTHVPRELNKLADSAVNETLDLALHKKG